MKRILSGIKPSGDLNIGGYSGALSQFVRDQSQFECFYFIPDLHAITVYQDPKELNQRSRELAALYVAAGLDPKKSAIFLQSHVAAHAELGWLMETQSHFGELSRMTQFKDKSEGKDIVSAALFTYPSLMAADILLYQATHVPVGDDQKQHLELTRDLANRFNNRYGETFTVPEPIIRETGARIMGLDDPSSKMSKSNPNASSYILMLDEPAVIRKKFSRAVTDSEMSIRYDWDTKPAVSNLIEIYSVFTGKTIAETEAHFAGQGYGNFKKEIAEAVIAVLEPIQQRFREIVHSEELTNILRDGAERASAVANETLRKAKENMGFLMP